MSAENETGTDLQLGMAAGMNQTHSVNGPGKHPGPVVSCRFYRMEIETPIR